MDYNYLSKRERDIFQDGHWRSRYRHLSAHIG